MKLSCEISPMKPDVENWMKSVASPLTYWIVARAKSILRSWPVLLVTVNGYRTSFAPSKTVVGPLNDTGSVGMNGSARPEAEAPATDKPAANAKAAEVTERLV